MEHADEDLTCEVCGRLDSEHTFQELIAHLYQDQGVTMRTAATVIRRTSKIITDMEPTLIDLVVELREALGLFAGAMPITPKAAWDEAIREVKRLKEERA